MKKITVEFMVNDEQLKRLQALAKDDNIESYFQFMMMTGSKLDIDNKLDFCEKYLK